MMSRTVIRGSSEPTGSWNTICISRLAALSERPRSPTRSRPSNLIEPEGGSPSRISVRPSVDLPQPDSPTSPTVCPGRTSRSTPSTACTWPVTRCSTPCRIGKCLTTARALTNGTTELTSALLMCGPDRIARAAFDQPTRGLLRTCVHQLRILTQAPVERIVAARRKPTTSRPGQRIGHDPAYYLQLFCLRHPEQWYRVQQRFGIRMLRTPKHIRSRAPLDHPTCIHHGDVVAHFGHDAEVVRDQNDRHPEPLTKLLDELEDLRLDRDVERGRRLVRDEQLRLARERHRDHHPLPHPSGQLVRVLAEAPLWRREADQVQHLQSALTRRGQRHAPVQHHRLDDLVADLQHGVQRSHRLLEDHRDLVAPDLPQLVFVEQSQVPPTEQHA